MKLVIPHFWYRKHIISYLLLPLALLYRGVFFFRSVCACQTSFNKVTLTVGNVTLGGAGKTPTSIVIAQLLRKRMIKSTFLSRGYLGQIDGPIIINQSHSAVDVGDEALLLSKHCNTVISKKRYLAKELVDNMDVDCVIMDDGLQNFKVKHDIKILVVDVSFLFGNGFLVPAGPLRERYKEAMERVDYIIYIGSKDVVTKLEFYKEYSSKSFFAKYVAESRFSKQKLYLAFSAISNNQKFFSSLRQEGYDVQQIKEYPDHYFYSQQDIESLLDLAKKENLVLITTSKDMVKIPGKYRKDILEFKIKLQLEQEVRFVDDLVMRVKQKLGKC